MFQTFNGLNKSGLRLLQLIFPGIEIMPCSLSISVRLTNTVSISTLSLLERLVHNCETGLL